MEWNQSSPSSHAGTVTRGSCFQVLSWVEVTPIHPPGSKHDQSYLTYLWSQLKVIDMLNNHERRLAAQLLLYKTALNGPAPRVQSPMLRLVQWGHPTYIFLIFPGHLEFWTPLQIPIWKPLLAAPCYTVAFSKILIWAINRKLKHIERFRSYFNEKQNILKKVTYSSMGNHGNFYFKLLESDITK